jgi:hypothetical protein
VGKPSVVTSDDAARKSACATLELKQLFFDRLLGMCAAQWPSGSDSRVR